MHPDIEPVPRLHTLDNRLLDIAGEIKRLPVELATLEATLEGHKSELQRAKDRLAENQKTRRQHEADISAHEAKITKLRGQMGEAKTNEQYHAFQHEIGFAEKAISDCEEAILELMEEAETLTNSVAQAEKDLAAEAAEVEKQKQATRERVEADKQDVAETQAAREALHAQLSAEGQRNYDRARKRLGRRAVAEMRDGRCLNCSVMIRPAFAQILRRHDQLMNCETCGCILYEPQVVAAEDPAGDHNHPAA